MFNGKILAFLCQPTADGPGFNSALIDQFYDLFNGADGLTLLDQTVLELARLPADVRSETPATSNVLLERHYPDQPNGPGALLPGAHARFQQDMETVVDLKSLNRRDRVTSAMNIFYVHLALYFQRLGWLLEEEFALANEAATDPTVQLSAAKECFSAGWDDSPFAGSIQFRVTAGRSEPVRMTDGCVVSYLEQNRRQLLLPANLSVLGAARAVMAACGQPSQQWTFAAMTEACRSDDSLNQAFTEALQQMATETVRRPARPGPRGHRPAGRRRICGH